jgi:hypothetical protein
MPHHITSVSILPLSLARSLFACVCVCARACMCVWVGERALLRALRCRLYTPGHKDMCGER